MLALVLAISQFCYDGEYGSADAVQRMEFNGSSLPDAVQQI